MSTAMTLHVVQAHHGDCLLLEMPVAGSKRFMLVDGGPGGTYDPFLRRALAKVNREAGALDVMACSHVDDDHVRGLLDYFVESRSRVGEGKKPVVKVKDLWHDSFGKVTAGTDIESRLATLMTTAAALGGPAAAGVSLREAGMALESVRQGAQLAREARLANVRRNGLLGGDPFVADAKHRGPHAALGAKVTVVGPTQANLDALRAKWLDWLEDNEEALQRGDFDLAAMTDKSVPNLGSVQLMVERGGKRLLLTGDGRGDHLLQALGEAGLLDAGGGIDVDVLKVPHHGSSRNVDRDFFRKVRATTYVISADGKHGNPDDDTFEWIVDAAVQRGARITLALTNETPSLRRLEQSRPPATHDYRVRMRAQNRSWLSVRI